VDKATAKLLLESMRPQDAGDPAFAEALRLVTTDPELAAWYADLQAFDGAVRGKLQDIDVPPGVKENILAGYRIAERLNANPKIVRMPRQWFAPVALAATIMVGLIAWRLIAPPPRPMHSLEMQAIAYTQNMHALQFVCFDANAVAGWVNQQPEAQQVGLQLPMPGDGMKLKMIGASMVTWNGHPVVMMALQDGKKMAMLYVMKADDIPNMPDGTTETMQHGDWVVRATKVNGQVHLLAAKGTPDDLDFQMPFTQGA